MKTLIVAGANPKTANLGYRMVEDLAAGYDDVQAWHGPGARLFPRNSFDLVCCVGKLEIGLLKGKNGADLAEEVSANLIVPLLILNEVLQIPDAVRRVVMIGSMAYRKALTGYSVYAACKAGLAAAVQNVAYENAKDLTFRVWTVAPGTIEGTPIATKTIQQTAAMKGKYSGEVETEMRTTFPTGRMVDAQSVFDVVKFCFSGKADQMNGHCFEIANNQR